MPARMAYASGGDLTCEDGNPCTMTNVIQGPDEFVANANACDDANACTTCRFAKTRSVGGELLDCDDGDVCTDDSCDMEKGCIHVVNEAQCDDGDACTVGDQCKEGSLHRARCPRL